MGTLNEGVRRLSLVLGVLGLALWALASIVLMCMGFLSDSRLLDKEELRLCERKGHEAKASLDSIIALGRKDESQDAIKSIERYLSGLPARKGKKEWEAEVRQWEEKIRAHEKAIARRRNRVAVIALGAVASFLLPWGTVRTAGWIVAGFRQGRKE